MNCPVYVYILYVELSELLSGEDWVVFHLQVEVAMKRYTYLLGRSLLGLDTKPVMKSWKNITK